MERRSCYEQHALAPWSLQCLPGRVMAGSLNRSLMSLARDVAGKPMQKSHCCDQVLLIAASQHR